MRLKLCQVNKIYLWQSGNSNLKKKLIHRQNLKQHFQSNKTNEQMKTKINNLQNKAFKII